MARMFKNVNTGVIVTPPTEQAAAMYEGHPAWEEVKKSKKTKEE